MKTTTVYKLTIAILVAINITIIALLIFRPPFPGGPQEPIIDIISDKLELNEAQREQYKELAKAHKDEIRGLMKKQQALTNNYFKLLTKQENAEKKAALEQELQQISARKLQVTYAHFADLKKLCNTDQQARFDEIIDDILKIMLPVPKEKLPPGPRR